MFVPGERAVVAVSGGPDSVALLNILRELNASLCLKLAVAHLDHNVRRGSVKDLEFVKNMAKEFNLPFYSRVINWKKEKKTASLEDCLRKLRYEFLFDTAKVFGAKKIAVGHTQDDQAETVLMRILRGSGLYGLSAILPVRSIGDAIIVRPMIEIERRQIEGYLKEKNILSCTDESNTDEKFLRNKVRKSLLPLLQAQYNPNIKEGLCGLALMVGADYAFIEKEAECFIRKYIKMAKDRCSIALPPLKALDVSLRRVVLRCSIEALKGDLRRLSFKHLQEVEDLVSNRIVGSIVHLPQGFCVLKTKETLLLSVKCI